MEMMVLEMRSTLKDLQNLLNTSSKHKKMENNTLKILNIEW